MLLIPARSIKASGSRRSVSKTARIRLAQRKFTRPTKDAAAAIPRKSGIYFIVCKATGRFYEGSAVDLLVRRRTHWNALLGGKHANKHLQPAWRRRGEANFEFRVVDLVRPSRLIATEQSWLDKTNCIDPSIGFNILPRALSSASVAVQARKGFVDPRGKPVTITNLHKFCRQNGLGFVSMMRLYKVGTKLKFHKGWTHKNSVRIRDYVKTHTGFINPYGKRIGKITNLHEFSRSRGLTAAHMIAVAHDRIRSHRGWTHINSRERLTPKIYSGFIRPDGRRTVIINLSRFCRENGLSVVHMHNLKSGIRRIHKGWTWNPE
jgi:group I intron endonuclease